MHGIFKHINTFAISNTFHKPTAQQSMSVNADQHSPSVLLLCKMQCVCKCISVCVCASSCTRRLELRETARRVQRQLRSAAS